MAMKFDSGFEILRFSDVRYEELTVEIQYKGEAILQINKDKGLSSLEIDILVDFVQSDFHPKFMLNEFLFVINEAKKILIGNT